MLKKIILPLLFCGVLINAQETSMSIEDKYAACEKAYDTCIEVCDLKSDNYEECISKCDENLTKCNYAVEDITPTQEK